MAITIDITGFEDDQPPVTGIFHSGDTTDDTSPLIRGTISAPLEMGQSVLVMRDDVQLLLSAKVDGTTWSYQDSGVSNGTYMYSAQVIDVDGTPMTASGAFIITVATAAIAPAGPTQKPTILEVQDNMPPVIGLIADGSITNDDTPTFRGTLSAPLTSGQSLHIFRTDVGTKTTVDVGTALVAGTSWKYEDGGLQDGRTYTYTAQVVDRDGNKGPESDSITFTLDLVIPPGGIEIEHIVDNVEPNSGDISNNGFTNDTSPRLTGSLLMRLATGQKVEVLRDGEVVGTATMTGNTTWAFQDGGLLDKSYIYTARIVNADGTEVSRSSAWNITVDTTVPTATPRFTGFTDDVEPGTGEFQSGASTNDLTPLLHGTITGTLGPNDQVTIYRDGTKISTVPVQADGTWSHLDSGLRDGQTYTYTARVEDKAGNSGNPSAEFKIIIDTTPPTATAPVSAIVEDTGASASDFITSDTTLVISGTVTGTLGAGEKVQVSLDKGATWHEAVTTGSAWTYDNTATPLSEGEHTIQTRVIDLAQNVGRVLEKALTIDTTAPTATAPVSAITEDTGVPGDFITSDQTLVISGTVTGTLGAGEKVQVSLDGANWHEAVVTGSAWTYDNTATTLAEGDYKIQTRVIDLAGNTGAVQDKAFTISLVPEPIPKIAAIVEDTGASASDFITSDQTLVISGTVSKALSDGEKVQVSLDKGVTWHDAVTTGSAWTYDNTATTLADGNYTIQARVLGRAGTPGLVVEQALVIDTTPPSATAPITAIVEDTGASATDFITSDQTLVISGTVSGTLGAGEKVQVSLDGTAWHEAVVTGSAWTYDNTATALAEGDHKIHTRVIDLAGNIGSVADRDLRIDITAPTAKPSIGAIEDDTGASATDFITNDQTLLFSGTLASALAADEKTQVSLDNGLTWHDAITVGTNWSWDNTANTLAEGNYTIQVRAIDLAGNIGSTASQALVIDTTPPTATAPITAIVEDTGSSASDFITKDTTLVISGTVSEPLVAGDRVQVSLNNGLDWNFANVTGSVWTLDNTAHTLTEGDYTVKTRVVDLAGNLGAEKSQVITIDTTPPAAATVKINAIAGNDVLDQGEIAGSVTISGTLTDVPADAVTQELTVKVGGVSHTPTITGTSWSFTVAGSELASAAAGARGSVVAQLTLADLAGNTTQVNESRSYVMHVEPPPGSLYSVGTAKAGLGYSMSVIGDFNGDGYNDYVVSAPGTHNGGFGTASAYVLYGGPNGLPIIGGGLANGNLDNITAAQGFKISNSNGTGHFGFTNVSGGTVTDIGDFNGDGLSDIAMVSPMTNIVYVIYGQRGNTLQNLDLNKLTASQGFKVTAVTGFLYGVTGLDVNGDGYSDLMFSDPTAGPKVVTTTAGLGGGAAYVVYGHAGTQSNISTVANSSSGGDGNSTTLKGAGTLGSGYTVLTSNGYTGLGTVINAVGDVNGDGYTDYVATAPDGMNWGNDKPGWAYLVFGGPNGITAKSGIVNMTTLDNMAANGQGIKISASNAYEFLGGKRTGGVAGSNADAVYGQYHSVDSLGNIDGSGKTAFAIGSPGAINPYTCADRGYPGTFADGAGAVYVMYGDPGSWSNITLPAYNGGRWTGGSLNGSNGFVIYSSSFAARANGTQGNASDLGFAVSSAGDVNGDGVDDFLIGAPQANSGKGAVFLVFGTTNKDQLWATDPFTGKVTPGVVDLDQLVALGKTSAFGAPGTAVRYDGMQADPNLNGSGSYMGTDVTGGDFSGTGIHGYVFGAWGDNVWNTKTGQVYSYNGVTAFLTQQISNADNVVYYAGKTVGGAPISDGVDLIATGSGNNVWVHGIGTDTTADSTDLKIQHDAVSGGKGSDYIGIVSTNFTSVSGGGGTDTLVFEASNLTLNLAKMGLRVHGFEQFDLNNQLNTAATDPEGLFIGKTTGNRLELRLADVLNEPDAVSPSQHVTIYGDSTSSVALDSGWMTSGMQTIGGVSFGVWHNWTTGANTAADLLIQQGVIVTY